MNKNITFSFDQIGGIEKLIEVKPTCARIFLFLAKFANEENVVVASSSVLETALNKTRSYISGCVKYLRDNHYLAMFASGQTSVYILNKNILLSENMDHEYENIEVLTATLLLSPKESECKRMQVIEEK